MAHERLTLDNPIFAQALRQPSRSVPAYRTRPTHPQTAQDMMFIRSAARPQAAIPDNIPPAKRPVLRESAQLRPSVRPVQAAVAVREPASISATTPQKRPKHRAHRVRLAKAPLLLYVCAGVLFIAGGYVAFSSLRTDSHVKAQVKQLQKASASAESDTPTAEKPSTAAVSGYAVAPNLARYLDIPKLSVHARVIPLGVKSDNTLKAPRNGYDVGWYDASSRPGENGAMLIDGHSNVLGKRAVFAKLGKLAVGDELKVTRGDGKVFSYRVRTVEIVDNKKVDMSSLLISADTAKPGLNLITCAGDVIPGTLHLDKRALVRAVLE